jgi:uncharacterized membrane protein
MRIEEFGLLLLVVWLLLPIVALVQSWLTVCEVREIRKRLDELQAGTAAARQPEPAAGAAPPPVVSPPPILSPSAAAPPAAAVSAVAPPLPPMSRLLASDESTAADAERFLGGKFLAWAGGATLFLAAVFFIVEAFQRGWISVELRVALEALFGAALIAAGVCFRETVHRVTMTVLTSTGLVTLFAVVWACRMFHKFALFTPEVTFVALFALCVGGFSLARLMRAQVVAVFGLLAGLAVPFLTNNGADLPFVYFAYFTGLLNAVFIACGRFNWPFLPFVAGVGVSILYWEWFAAFVAVPNPAAAFGYKVFPESLLPPVFMTCFAVMTCFAMIYVSHFGLKQLASPRESEIPSPPFSVRMAVFWTGAALAAQAFLVTVGRAVIRMSGGEKLCFVGLAVFLAAFLWAIARFDKDKATREFSTPCFALLSLAGVVLAESASRFRSAGVEWTISPLEFFCHLGVALAFVAWPVVDWRRWRENVTPFAVGAVALPLHYGVFVDDLRFFLTEENKFVLPLLLAVPTLAAFVLLKRTQGPPAAARWFGVATVFFVALAAWERFSGYELTVAWAVFALALLSTGLWRWSAGTRWLGLGLFGLVLTKLLFFDLAGLGHLYRVAAFAAAAVAALAASLLYQRFFKK